MNLTTLLTIWTQPFLSGFEWLPQLMLANGAAGRLLTACLLGGVIGLEREIKRKAAGVRTNLLICMGSAFFTLLSAVLVGDSPDKSRVASNIVQGIGFLGAGLILHNRSRVSGLTSAASVFVVASIGMACGAGLYPAAVVATLIVVASLEGVGVLERKASLKLYPLVYEARGDDQTQMEISILAAMTKTGERLATVERDIIGDVQRVSFTLTATRKSHDSLRAKLAAEPAIKALFTFRDPEED
ncbi:MgtC/SapB family protein [Telmatobacter bradus]|uniref:MgtC/SapB family protein n=1 Tax=Telmatobacter bradus TaxID=474953 RepID=UPI003B4381A0